MARITFFTSREISDLTESAHRLGVIDACEPERSREAFVSGISTRYFTAAGYEFANPETGVSFHIELVIGDPSSLVVEFRATHPTSEVLLENERLRAMLAT